MYRLLIQKAETDELKDADSVFKLLDWSRLGMPPDAMKLLHHWNLDASQPSGSRDPSPPLLSPAQARLSFGSGAAGS
jgi:hypothetical protein